MHGCALRPLSLTEDVTAAAILALEYGGLRCAAAAFRPHLINCSPLRAVSEGSIPVISECIIFPLLF